MVSDGYVAWWNQVDYDAATERRLAAMHAAPAAGGTAAVFGGLPGKRVNGAGLNVTIGGSPEAVTVSSGGGVIADPRGDGALWPFEIPQNVTIAGDLSRPGAGQTRIDWIVAALYDVDSGLGSERAVKIERWAGSPGSSPTDPTVPAGSSPVYQRIATLTIPPSGTPVTVTPTPDRTAAAGGVVPMSTARRDALKEAGALYAGFTLYNTTTKQIEAYDGSAFLAGGVPNARRLLSRGPSSDDSANIPLATGTNLRITSGLTLRPGDGGNASGITLSGGTLTVTQSGLYYVDLRFIVPRLASSILWTVGVSLNGETTFDWDRSDKHSGGVSNISFTGHIPLNEGDSLQMMLRQVSGATQTIVCSSETNRWEVRRVGPL